MGIWVLKNACNHVTPTISRYTKFPSIQKGSLSLYNHVLPQLQPLATLDLLLVPIVLPFQNVLLVETCNLQPFVSVCFHQENLFHICPCSWIRQ